MQIHFQFEKSTKGAHRYQEVDQAGTPVDRAEIQVGSLYIRKSAMPEPAQALTVTIEAHGGGQS
jgi:hypothetical protein